MLVLKRLAYKEGLEGDLFYLDVIKYARMGFKRRIKEGAIDLGRHVADVCTWLEEDERKIVKLEGEVRKLRESKVKEVKDQSQAQDAHGTSPPHQVEPHLVDALPSGELDQARDSTAGSGEDVKTSQATSTTRRYEVVNSSVTEYERIRGQLERTEKQRENFRLLSEGRADYSKKLLATIKKVKKVDSTMKAEPAAEIEQIQKDADERVQALENLVALKETAVAALQKTTEEAVQKTKDAQNALARHHETAQELNAALERKDWEIEHVRGIANRNGQELTELKELKETTASREAQRREKEKALQKINLEARYEASLDLRDREMRKLKDSMAGKVKELRKLTGSVASKDKELAMLRHWSQRQGEAIQQVNAARRDQEMLDIKKAMDAQVARTKEIEAALDAKERASTALRDGVASKDEQLKQLKASIKQKDAESQLVKTNTDKKDRELAKLKKAQEFQAAMTTNTTAALQAKDNEINTLTHEMTSKAKELAQLKQATEAQAAITTDTTTKTTAVLQAKNSEIKALTHSTTAKTNEVEELKQAMQTQAAETEMLWNRVAQLQMESKKRMRSD